MGLQEGRRALLRSEELTDLEKQRVEERLFEQKMTLKRAYGRALKVLLLVAVLTLATVIIFPERYKLSFPLASQIAQLCMAFGYQGNMVLGFGLAGLVGGIFLLLWWLSRKHYVWMIVSTVLVVIDSAASFLMLGVMNQAFDMYNQSVGAMAGTAAGAPPGLGGSAYDFMTVFFVTLFAHVVVAAYLIYGAVKGAKLRKVPDVSIKEKKVEKAVYYDGEDYTEHPEEGTEPLREVPKGATRILQATVQGMNVEVCRAFGVTMLAVDGQVYNDQKGKVEPLYHLRACVNGVHLDAENRPAIGYSVMTLTADGEQVEQKTRIL